MSFLTGTAVGPDSQVQWQSVVNCCRIYVGNGIGISSKRLPYLCLVIISEINLASSCKLIFHGQKEKGKNFV